MKKLLWIFVCCSFPWFLGAQKPVLSKWWLEFTDKNDSPFSTARPAEFLSARALERRARAGVPVLEEDLPVNDAYLKAVRRSGAVLHNTSRWLNAAAIVADSATAALCARLPFVKRLTYLGPDLRFRNPPNRPPKKRKVHKSYDKAEAQFGYMGYSLINLAQPKTFVLHEAGARGRGIWVAVMDGGFDLVDTLPFFDSVALQRRLWPARDFVERDRGLFESSGHGTGVLSVMASNLPGFFVGAAPEATYFLMKTEDTGGEYPIEETNWIAGAEWADSAGVDIINASLGYTEFNMPKLGHRYAELDGKTAIGSRGASIAARKGMIICNSAGNEGDGPWKHIGVPADAPGIIAVGATDTQSPERAGFSSMGPTADGRIKPDLAMPGQNIVTAGQKDFELGMANGTSLASPLLAGSLAALWSAFPERPADEIMAAVYASTDQRSRPDNERGYGMPDFSEAWLRLNGFIGPRGGAGPTGYYCYDSAKRLLSVVPFSGRFAEGDPYTIKDAAGRKVFEGNIRVGGGRLQLFEAERLPALPPGVYTLSIVGKTRFERYFFTAGK